MTSARGKSPTPKPTSQPKPPRERRIRKPRVEKWKQATQAPVQLAPRHVPRAAPPSSVVPRWTIPQSAPSVPSQFGRPVPGTAMPAAGHYTYAPQANSLQLTFAQFLPFIDYNADTLSQFAQIAIAYEKYQKYMEKRH